MSLWDNIWTRISHYDIEVRYNKGVTMNGDIYVVRLWKRWKIYKLQKGFITPSS